jgi:hypothetical protein
MWIRIRIDFGCGSASTWAKMTHKKEKKVKKYIFKCFLVLFFVVLLKTELPPNLKKITFTGRLGRTHFEMPFYICIGKNLVKMGLFLGLIEATTLNILSFDPWYENL